MPSLNSIEVLSPFWNLKLIYLALFRSFRLRTLYSSPGPEFTTLTLVDLPGAHFANDDPRMNLVTQDLVLEYIEKNTNSIIVIVSEVGDPTGDSAINLVMQKAPDFRSRTICALTKPDKLRESDDMGKRVAMNGSSFTLDNNRFIVLRGKIWLFSLFYFEMSP